MSDSDFRFQAWPTEFRSINQYFGANPQNYAQFGLPGHEGVDIMAPMGSRVYAVAPGQVIRLHAEPTGHNYGIHVVVGHKDSFSTTYAHLKEVRVGLGQAVEAGSLLGLADDTGNSFGAHLHLTLKREGIKEGEWPPGIMDPMPYLLPLMGWAEPAGPYLVGWVFSAGITRSGKLAQANWGGVNLRDTPSVNGRQLALVPAGTLMICRGQEQGQYTAVDVPQVAVGLPLQPGPSPEPPAPETVVTVDGWGWQAYLAVAGEQAVVGPLGINLRTAPDREASNIGIVAGGKTVSLLGAAQGDYLPVRARRADFLGPVALPHRPVEVAPGEPLTVPAGALLGWAWTPYLTLLGGQAVVGRFGLNLRARPDRNGANLGLLKGAATVAIAGMAEGEYTPVVAWAHDVANPLSPQPAVQPPQPLPGPAPVASPPEPGPSQQSTPGWVATAHLVLEGGRATAGIYGLNLRQEPRLDAPNIGFVPANASLIITGPPQGQYTPVRVDDDVVQPPFDAAAAAIAVTLPAPDPAVINPDPLPLGRARLGLHASADPGELSEAEFAEFAALRPSIIKVLSAHSGQAIARLAGDHPQASWIVRAFLHFGGRQISPEQFLQDTLPDVGRALAQLPGKDVVVELHNEPNLVMEGLGSTWADGASFAQWWLDLLARYRLALPGVRFIYPGLSPGSQVTSVKQDHIQFLEASRAAVEAADGLGIHLYWSAVYPMESTLAVLDDYISRFRFKPIWVTEASNNKAGPTPYHKAQQYLRFWQALQQRPTVQGVTFFVASGSNPAFAEEVWVGRQIGRLVGRR